MNGRMTQAGQPVDTWCRVCGTIHEDDETCLGELLSTGSERHGFRLLADTPRGPEVYGTLVAPTGNLWRARILTFPNILWVIPHGGTMKFVAGTPAEAERKAIQFMKEHCRHRGYPMRTEVPSVESGEVDLEQDELAARSRHVRASQRQLRTVTVRFGVRRPTKEAETDDLSEGGLFIRTGAPSPIGTTLQIRLEAEGFGIPLRGVVRWVRQSEEDGRPAGMGVRLTAPHPRYLHYVRQQRGRRQSGAEEATTYEVEERRDDE